MSRKFMGRDTGSIGCTCWGHVDMARADRSKMDPLTVQCIAQIMQDKEADLVTINKWLAEVGA